LLDAMAAEAKLEPPLMIELLSLGAIEEGAKPE
jgi:hypothetical protein